MKGKNRYAKSICILILGVVSLVLLCLLAKNYNLSFLQEIDTNILQFMVEHTNEYLTVVMNIITFFGTIGGVTLILILMIFISRFQKEMLLYSVLVLFTYLINGFMKNIVMRPRPNITHLTFADGYSFVSGHSSISIVLSVTLIAFFVPKIKKAVLRNGITVFLCIMPFCIAISRMYLRVHYFTDILGGWFVAITYLCTLYFGFHFITDRKRGKTYDK
jgi:undecaprenyl-diphosphatase